jgi:hypothetical protein
MDAAGVALCAQGNRAHQAGNPSAKNCDLHAAPYK